ncbi:MAG: hypothetical protein M3380_13110 [Chloroflexota bacterium]|nr:hypothetical protein [Chloroflexota bacterium]
MPRHGRVAVSGKPLRGKTPAVLLRQRGIDRLPWGLTHLAKDRMASFMSRALERVQGRLRLERSNSGSWKSATSELGHLVWGVVCYAPAQHANTPPGTPPTSSARNPTTVRSAAAA